MTGGSIGEKVLVANGRLQQRLTVRFNAWEAEGAGEDDLVGAMRPVRRSGPGASWRECGLRGS